MKRSAVSARQGIALVITLIMLSVVTITAVAFLAVARRDRGASVATGEQMEVRFLADAALNRARAEISSGIATANNRSAFRFFVSTNYINPRANPSDSYLLNGNLDALTNVNYLNTTDPANPRPFDLSSSGDRELYRRMLANLFYSPRAPVYVVTNRNARNPSDFRFYLDLNRNGRFETNGLIVGTDSYGKTNGFVPENVVGDPEWEGILQHPDVPHSGTNLFVGRVAYVVVPSGRNLDINFNHNSVKSAYSVADLTGNGQSAFMRNEAAGGWEVNLAGFLSDLNTNIWPAYSKVSPYRYNTNLNTPSSGLAFDDASLLVRYRRTTSAPTLASSQDFLARDSGTNANAFAAQIKNDGVDLYSDGPIATSLAEVLRGVRDNDQPTKSWAGSDFTNSFIEPSQLFSLSVDPSASLYKRLTGIGQFTSPLSTYDNYTFYRMIGQLGLDSSDSRFETGFHPVYATGANPYGFYRRAKLNVNYAMDNPDGDRPTNAAVASVNGLRQWAPIQWFTNAANRLLLTEFTNGLPFTVIDTSGTKLNPGLAVLGDVTVRQTNYFGNTTSIQTYRTNYVYNPQVHRLLQLAANIYDYTTNAYPVSSSLPGLPSVFRPLLYRDSTTNNVLRLGGYSEVRFWNADFLNNWYAPNDPQFLSSLPQKFNTAAFPGQQDKAGGPKAYGVPWIIGAKKGLPAFHEAFWQSAVQVTRRLLFERRAAQTVMSAGEVPFVGGNGKGFDTLVQYRLRITNSVAVDAYYPYTNPLPRAVRIYVKNFHNFTLKSDLTGGSRIVFNRQINFSPQPVDVAANTWKPLTYVTAMNSAQTNSMIYDVVYDPVQGAVYDSGTNYNAHFVSASAPFTPLTAFVTNSLVFVITEQLSGRVIDLVTLQSTMVETNFIRYLGGTTTGGFGNLPLGGNPGGVGGGLTAASLWSTNQLFSPGYGTTGISNQFRIAVGKTASDNLWNSAVAGIDNAQDKVKAIAGLNYFLYHTSAADLDKSTKAAIDQAFVMQAGYNPSASVFLTDRRMANDPLVHYTADDLVPGYSAYGEPGGYAEVVIGGVRRTPQNGKAFTLDAKVTTNQVGLARKLLTASAPWGTNANYGYFVPPKADDANSSAFDMAYKDPGITQSDDWNFPTNRSTRFPNIGHLGRVHRGTPWQTVYLKSSAAAIGTVVSRMESAKNWGAWAGNVETYAAKDRNLFDLFTTAINDNAARGLMGVNQTNLASWSALLSGVPILASNAKQPIPQLAFIQPSSTELKQVLVGYTNTVTGEIIPGLLRTLTNTVLAPGGYFTGSGGVLATPTLSDRSPFLYMPTNQLGWNRAQSRAITDEVVERLPQQVLSLIKADEPRFTVYSFAQTLKPAQNSLVTAPGPFFGLCTNYQVTSEYSTKTILRFDGPPRDLKAVVEDQRVLYPSN